MQSGESLVLTYRHIGEKVEDKNMTEQTLRKKLNQQGYKLVTTKSYEQYGTRIREYAIADSSSNVIVSGETMSLADVEDWINQNEDNN